MDGGSEVVERGVLTASDEAWSVAVRQAEVIGRLAREPRVGVEAANAATAELGVSRRQVYVLLRRWRQGEGVVSDLLPGRSGGGRGRSRLPTEVEALLREVIRSRYLSRQRRSVAAVYKEVVRLCRARGLPVPARNTLVRRIAMLDPVAAASAREGAEEVRALRSAGGEPPVIEDCWSRYRWTTRWSIWWWTSGTGCRSGGRTSPRRSMSPRVAWSGWSSRSRRRRH